MGLLATKRLIVLVVEDEFLIRMSAAEMIEAAGFEVIEASSADAAIEILQIRADIAIVFTDIQMPGSMDGLKLAAAVRDRWPPVRIVATSGQLKVQADDLPEGSIFLSKPYSSGQITQAFRSLMRSL
jgi:CheY-like chemotaxis protein